MNVVGGDADHGQIWISNALYGFHLICINVVGGDADHGQNPQILKFSNLLRVLYPHMMNVLHQFFQDPAYRVYFTDGDGSMVKLMICYF